MKYLKLFENHNPYYELLDNNRFRREVSFHERVRLSKNTYDKLCVLFPVDTDGYFLGHPRHKPGSWDVRDFSNSEWTFQCECRRDDNFEVRINITETDDEWYWLWIDTQAHHISGAYYYKCDRWDGLLKCLKDTDII